MGSSVFAKSAIPQAAIDRCPIALRSYLPLLCFGKADAKGYKETLGIFETKAEAGEEAAQRLLQAVAIGRTDAPAIRPALARKEAKVLILAQERHQVYLAKQAAHNEVAKADKAVESSNREVHRSKDKISDLEQALASAKEELAKKLAFHQEQLVKLRSANSTLQLEVQKLEAFRIRQESEGLRCRRMQESLRSKAAVGSRPSRSKRFLQKLGVASATKLARYTRFWGQSLRSWSQSSEESHHLHFGRAASKTEKKAASQQQNPTTRSSPLPRRWMLRRRQRRSTSSSAPGMGSSSPASRCLKSLRWSAAQIKRGLEE